MTFLVPLWNDALEYGFESLRAIWDSYFQEGVLAPGDLKVTQGTGMNVNIAAGAGFVRGDTGTRNGLYRILNDAPISNAVAVTASNGTNPRIDQIVVKLRDTTDMSGASDTATPEVVTGTATAGATLDNRSGAASLPADAMRLADVLVPAASSSVTNANIRDRRPWAKGANTVIQRTAGNYTTSSASIAAVDATNLKPRVECSGGVVVVSLRATALNGGASVTTPYFRLYQDGSWVSGQESYTPSLDPGYFNSATLDFYLTPAAGSHQFEFYWATTGAVSTTLYANTTQTLTMRVREEVLQNASNA